ncbi:alpha-N-acetylneuraminide alpha-2,8-sialyltransferase-like [Lytechinus variegatus]|uniref:alpha-N-acetylneuraminide alpha-2,8-sialyltransferase-like n=1 Tax=Lytechinus variegatus TaxID=7654 RepID=UPI001BB19C7F|nr:alpha-N-acetylneuraminide alpha-2,8-sialyltransferase-like [Lytechinus variegatus]
MARRYQFRHKLTVHHRSSSFYTENASMLVILAVAMATIFTISYFTANASELMANRARPVGTSRLATPPKTPPPAEPMSKHKSDQHFTPNLWNFVVNEAEKLFLYQHFLETPWKRNTTNEQLWRSEWQDLSPNCTAEKDFVLTQTNVKENDSLVYSLYRKVKGKAMKQFKVTKQLMQNIPNASPLDGVRLGRCSLVGNSGILLNSDCGKQIDQADFVFRCNTAPLAPFRSDAGVKSNLTTMNPSIIERRFNFLKEEENITSFAKAVSQYNGDIWLPCFGVQSHTKTCLKALDVYEEFNPRLLVANPAHFRLVWDFWKQRKFGSETLSTGFYLVHIALSVCEETHLYGFWPFSSQLDPFPGQVHEVPYHYFDGLKFTKNHDMSKEFQVLLQMHKHGLLRMHVGKCP